MKTTYEQEDDVTIDSKLTTDQGLHWINIDPNEVKLQEIFK